VSNSISFCLEGLLPRASAAEPLHVESSYPT
jgi:hypothetical protein